MAEVGGEASARGGKAFDGLRAALRKGQPAGKVRVGGQGRGEPVPQPSDFVFGRKVEVVESNACSGGGRAFLGRTPVNELSLGDREG